MNFDIGSVSVGDPGEPGLQMSRTWNLPAEEVDPPQTQPIVAPNLKFLQKPWKGGEGMCYLLLSIDCYDRLLLGIREMLH